MKRKITSVPFIISMIIIFFVVIPVASFNSYLRYKKYILENSNLHDAYYNNIHKGLSVKLNNIARWIDLQFINSEEKAKFVIKSRSDNLFSILEGLHNKRSPLLKKGKNLNDLGDLIRNIGYYYAFSLDGTLKIFPKNPEFENTSVINVKGQPGKLIFKEMTNIVKKDGMGFYKNYWTDPASKNSISPIISYIRVFKPLNWVIGTGINFDFIKEEIKKNLIQTTNIWKSEMGDVFFIFDDSGSIVAGTFPPVLSEKANIYKKEIINNGKSHFKYFTYFKPDSKRTGLPYMIIHSRYYKEFGWTVAMGTSNEKFSNFISQKRRTLRKGIVQSLSFILLIMISVATLMLFLSRFFKNQIRTSFSTFTDFFNKARSEFNTIDVDTLRFHEFRKLARYANDMINERMKKDKIIKEFTRKLEDANSKLKEIANIDGLTQITNRRHFDEILNKEWARAVRNRDVISVGLLDIDFFKFYNDTYGHQLGDECLRLFAFALKNSLQRPADLVARYGGEEFIVLLPETDVNGAEKIAEKMKDSVSKLNIKHKSSEVSDIVTFSMGIASVIPSKGSEASSIVGNADKALYLAKSEGRNIHRVFKE
ncbi:MAG: diguanylate cyclase [Desulfobacterales bacterium]|nr:diguanylate cyclase [Desulfobacterales bacterium]